jgi:hypothetical protein
MELVAVFIVVLVVPIVIWVIAETCENPVRRRIGTVIAMLILGVLATLSYGVGYFLGQSRATIKTTGNSLVFFEEASAALDAGRVDEVQQALARLREKPEEYRPWVYGESIDEAVVMMRGEE